MNSGLELMTFQLELSMLGPHFNYRDLHLSFSPWVPIESCYLKGPLVVDSVQDGYRTQLWSRLIRPVKQYPADRISDKC